MDTVKLSSNNQESAGFSSQEWLSYRAIAKHKEGKIEEAIAFYLEIVEQEIHQPRSLYVNLISLMSKLDMVDKAIEIGNLALDIHPNSSEIHRNLGMLFGKKQELDNSIKQYELALQSEPLQPEWVFINLTKTLIHTHQLNRAYEFCKAGLNFYAQSNYLQKIRLKTLIDLGSWQEIKTIFANSNLDDDTFECLLVENTFLLNEYTIYLECNLKEDWHLEKIGVLTTENDSNVHWFGYDENSISLLIVFGSKIDFSEFNLLLFSSTKLGKVKAKIKNKAYGLELIDYINSKPNYDKCIVKENIIHGIINNSQPERIDCAQELVQKLQSFVTITPQVCNNINYPFSIYFDSVVPIQGEGLFLNGWMSDPFEMLEEIDAISSLGFNISLKDNLHYVDRHDVNKAIKNTPYKGINKQLGIIAYVPFSEEIRHKFKPYSKQLSFRFQIKLRGNINKDVIPQATYYTGTSGMTSILNSFVSNKVNTSLLNDCIAPATIALGKACSQESTAIEIQNIGQPIVDNPIASIIVPINKSFDLFKVQFAMMANDDSIRRSEIIYILNSLEQKHQWERILENYSCLYNLPIKLIASDFGNNYGALTNIGTANGKSDLLISMLPDVLPKTQNWVERMADFYHSLDKPGTLTPKLIYEDLSIQHAGMTCEKAHNNSWSYKHFYQGLSSNYPPAQNNRSVPAINGACMMFSRQLHQETNGLSAEYLTPESEASDFCFKSLELGRKNWYFSDVEMYYFEKQNYFTELINQYNLNSQSEKWHQLMAKLNNK